MLKFSPSGNPVKKIDHAAVATVALNRSRSRAFKTITHGGRGGAVSGCSGEPAGLKAGVQGDKGRLHQGKKCDFGSMFFRVEFCNRAETARLLSRV
jgi:hypothetical protein